MPFCRDHYSTDGRDVRIRNTFLEKVAHRIHEHEFRRAPGKWLCQLFRDQSQIESLLIGVALDASKALRKGLSVTMLAAWTDLGAATHRVPSCIGPFDVGAFAHLIDPIFTLYVFRCKVLIRKLGTIIPGFAFSLLLPSALRYESSVHPVGGFCENLITISALGP